MRPLEVVVILLICAVLAAPWLPWSAARRALRPLPLLLLLAVIAQILIEGARWQLAPAYALALAVILLPLAPRGRRGERSLGALALGVVALAFALVLPLAFPVFDLPRPDGPYGIGTVTYDWTDPNRPELFTAAPGDQRELMVQVWYPATRDPRAARAPYIADGMALAPLARLLHMPDFVFQHLKYIRTNAMPGAPVAPSGRFPLLIFSHGRGGFRQHNSLEIESLVSHGYVVAAIDHTYAGAGVDFPDGRRVAMAEGMKTRGVLDRYLPYLARDVSFTLDRLTAMDRSDPKGVLTGRLDLDHVGMFGLSMGGAITAEACLRDLRLRACLPMDVFMPPDVVRSGLAQPTLWISRDAATMALEGWARRDIDETQSTMRAAYAASRGDAYLILVPGMFHQNLSDFPYLVVSPLDRWLGLDGPIDARRVHQIETRYSLAFFDRYLKGRASQLLEGRRTPFPEIQVLRRTGAGETD
jgi:predicted dienelactone hydrolase